MFAPAVIMRWMATSWASTEVPPDASVTTVTSQPSPSAWIAGATHISVHREDELLAAGGLDRVHDLLILPGVDERPIDHLLAGKHVSDLGEDAAAPISDHARQNRGHGEGLGSLRQSRRIVDQHLRFVAVHVCELIGLVVDQNEDRVLRTKKRIKSVTRVIKTSFVRRYGRQWVSRETCASGRRCLDAICCSFWLRPDSASPGSPIASHTNMWPPARSFRL
ncbi:hypothetical protein JOH52_004312 [Sinorhizobium meliloti]|nr:hypothetical protein [Sinorhizobium meliloti]